MEISSSTIKEFYIFSFILENGNAEKLFISQETKFLKSFLYFRKCNFYAQAQEIKKSSAKIYIFQKMEISGLKKT